MSRDIHFKAIGIIHSPWKDTNSLQGTPSTTISNKIEVGRGRVEIYKEYANNLIHLEDFSHLILIYYFHLINGGFDRVAIEEKSVFATRTANRPNPIGISTVRLVSIEDRFLNVEDLDVLDKSPLLDIKPYVPKHDLR